MAKKDKQKKEISKPGTAKELGPTRFTSQEDYEEQLVLEAETKLEEKTE